MSTKVNAALGITGILPVANGGTGSSSFSLTPVWVIKSSAYTAVAGDNLWVDTRSAAVAITLPATAAANATITIGDYAGTFGTNNLTINNNGLKLMGLLENMTVSTNNVVLTLTYIDATVGWRLS